MPFTPKTWVDGPAGGTPITAAELNRIEQGVDEVDAKVDLPPAVSSVQVVTGAEVRPPAAVVLWVGGGTRPTNMADGDLWFAAAPDDVPPVEIPEPVSRHAFTRASDSTPAVSDPGGYTMWPTPEAGSAAIPGVASSTFTGVVGPGVLPEWTLAVDFWINGPLADAGTFWTLVKITDSHFFEMNGLGVLDAFLGAGDPVTSSVAASVAAWHRLVVTYRASDKATVMYLDGAQVGTSANPAAPFTNPNWGGTNSRVHDDGFAGRIDNVTLWGSVLTPGQVTALGAAG